jgi:geranylgeranyl diphosphate synthase, type I
MKPSTLARGPLSEPAEPAQFSGLLARFRDRLGRELGALLAAKRAETARYAPEAVAMVDALSRLAEGGGKRLRPALVYYSYRACGGASDEAVLPLSLATELLHTYLLVHDDIMDHAEVRRGRPAAHAAFRDRHRAQGWRGDADDYGRSVAILVGDLANSYAFELFSRVRGADEERRAAIERCFTTMCQEVVNGQYLELLMPFLERPREEDLLRVLQLKSGRYSVERPIQLGALLAGAPETTLAPLSRYGASIGEAFQLQDDLLGLFGDAETVGKPVGSDLVEGKFTFVIFHTLALAAPGERRIVEAALGNPLVTLDEVERVRQVIRQSGALTRVREMIEERLAAARRALAGLELAPEGRAFLAGLIDYLWEHKQ